MDFEKFINSGIKAPTYNRGKMIKATTEHPCWLHFGSGNIFRGYIAALQDTLLEKNLTDKGIIAAEIFDGEIVETALRPYDNVCIAVTLKANGEYESRAIGSVARSLAANDTDELFKYFSDSQLQMVSLTITEKGYAVYDGDGKILPQVKKEIDKGPFAESKNTIVRLTSLCYKRYCTSKAPLALVSMDNCSYNGERLKFAIIAVADNWIKDGLIEEGFSAYISDEKCLAFPWSMIDRITPNPSAAVAEYLSKHGFEAEIKRTAKGTMSAPFVNMEECSYLVIEDLFPNGRPKLEEAGVLFTDRETVERCESMKVYTCLNPLHTALAVFGCLLGFKSISDEMADADINAFVRLLAYKEMLPVAVNPVVIEPKKFLYDVLNVRLTNKFIPDTPQRIATDTSQKMPVRFGNAIAAHIKTGTAERLKYIPLAVAGWCRYLVGKDDNGNMFEKSPDPCLEELSEIFSPLDFGITYEQALSAAEQIYKMKFLGDVPTDSAIISETAQYFFEMMKCKGAVRNLIRLIQTL